MYIPKANLVTDKNEIVSFMKQFSFATIVTVKDNRPVATHLPFLIADSEGEITLTSHFARANEQWMGMEESPVLVIFSEPHAYISPTYYEKEPNVPTWNYISVHAYGRGRVVAGQSEVFNILQSTISQYEPAFKQQWDKFPEDYRSRMANAIVAFEITVTDLQAKKKLSQNRTETERRNIIHGLATSAVHGDRQIADFMMKEMKEEI